MHDGEQTIVNIYDIDTYKFITVLYCSKKFYKFKHVSNNLLYNDFIVNVYEQEYAIIWYPTVTSARSCNNVGHLF